MKHFRIVAIAQIYNELNKGNLKRFIKHLLPQVDALVIYDDASTDGSYEYLKKITPHLIRGKSNDFLNEKKHKSRLLDAAIKLKPDFILWLDADEILSKGAREKLQESAQWCLDNDYDAMSFHEINLWRNASWQRIDGAYNLGWFVRLWRVKPNLRFLSTENGLHRQLYPESILKIKQTDEIEVIHYGFASDEAIIEKYLTYRLHGQNGWDLARLIDESTLQIKKVNQEIVPEELRANDPPPLNRTRQVWEKIIESKKNELLCPGVSIACLIYKSTKWLQFVYQQVLKYTNLDNKEFYFVANDADDTILHYLYNNYIPHYRYNNSPAQRKEWYINNVYRAWNYAADKAKGDFLLFINSDMAFTPGWDENLFNKIEGNNCVCSRLVESGKMPTGKPGISKNFGQSAEQYMEKDFLTFAENISEPKVSKGGLYMPLLIRRDDFLKVEGYPEGNVVPGSDPFQPKIAKKGEPVISGDVILMEKLERVGVEHQTVFDSLVYHFQEGEMSDQVNNQDKNKNTKIAVVNDHLTGVMGEKTMWNFLLDNLPATAGVDQSTVGLGNNFTSLARKYINKNYSSVDIIVQNASYIDIIDPSKYSIVYLQDNLRKMGRPSRQQENNLRLADLIVTNSRLTASSYPEYNIEIIPVGVDAELFKPADKGKTKQELGFKAEKIGIFVGDLSSVKGWDEVKNIIKQRQDIFWLIVSKSDQKYQAKNVKMFNRVDQNLLAKLYNCANFFLLGSKVETQCLAAIEAGMCNIPIIMHKTGIFTDFTEQERNGLGFFADNIEDKIDKVFCQKFNPREIILNNNLSTEAMIKKWYAKLMTVMTQVLNNKYFHPDKEKTNKKSILNHYKIKDGIEGILNIVKKVLNKILPGFIVVKLYRIYIRMKIALSKNKE